MLARTLLSSQRTQLEQTQAATLQAFRLQLQQVEARIAKLADLLIDGTVDKALYGEKQNALLLDRARIQQRLKETGEGSRRALDAIASTVELARSAPMLYKAASPEKRRELVKTLLSNLTVARKKVEITLAPPFALIENRHKPENGGPQRGKCRTLDQTIEQLYNHFQNGSLDPKA